MLIDTHCHFDVEEFDADRVEVAGRTLAAGVDTVVIPGYIAGLWEKMLKVCEAIREPRLIPVPGLHPCYVGQHEPAHLEYLEQLVASRPDIAAVGEIGLDYFLTELKSPEMKDVQQFYFRAQLELAARYHKPVILHVRKAHADVIRMLHDVRFREGGIVHAYSGGIEEARHYAKLGFRLGIGGPITYDQSRRLRDVAKDMPLEALVLETDAPDMTPQPDRKPGSERTRNSPEFLPSVARSLAEVKQVSLETIWATTRAQSLEVLRLAE